MRKLLLFIILLVSLFILSGCGNKPNVTGYAVQDAQNCRTVEVPYETQEEYVKTEYYTESVPYTDQECEDRELSYKSTDVSRNVECIDSHQDCKESHKNFWGTSVCDRYETICDQYRETASFEITNLDSEEKGLWAIVWYSECRANQPLCQNGKILIYSTGIYLDPTESEDTTASITYDAKGERYLYYELESKPTKQVCRDVIKSKEIQRSREVTAYRPVTKYRTEQKCD